MQYYVNEEGKSLVVDLREDSYDHRVRYEGVLECYTFLEKESYEDNLYHIYFKTESDWEDIQMLSTDLDDLVEEIDIEEIEAEYPETDYEDEDYLPF